MKLNDYDTVRGLCVDVDLREPPETRWLPAMEEVSGDVCRLMTEVEQWIEENLEFLPPFIQYIWRSNILRRSSVEVVGRLVGFGATAAGMEYARETKGIARCCGLSYPLVLLANIIYDLAQLHERLFANACSSFSFVLPDGFPALARNLDWGIPPGIGKYGVVVRFHHGRKSYLSLGVAGMTGILSAMRPGHWALTLNQAPSHALPFQLGQAPVAQRLRAVCDGFGTFPQLLRRLEEYQTFTPFFAHVIGRRPSEQVVLQGFGRETSRRTGENGMLVQTNHFAGGENRGLNGREITTDEFGQDWLNDTRPRYRALVRRLKKGTPVTLDEALAKLARPPVTHDFTIQSMAFCPGSGDWRLRVPID